MINREQVLDIISGRRRGILAATIRLGLAALTPIYALAVSYRNRRFDRAERNGHSTAIQKVDASVISVGNLTTGGTGKTPFVIYLCELLKRERRNVAIVSRGYGSHSKELPNDEALELQFRLPGIRHLQSPDRLQVAQRAVEECGATVIVLDDGFQHRRLHRDLDLVLIDCTNPFGYGRLLPRGLLREPMSSLGRCQAIILTRSELVSAEQKKQLVREVRQWNSQAVVAAVETRPTGWLRSDGTRLPIDQLNQRCVFVFCGIGNPQNFLTTVQRLGLEANAYRFFADHYRYQGDDLKQLSDSAKRCGATALLCTHKDLVKVAARELDGLPVYGLLVETRFEFGQAELERLVLKIANRT